jgi:methionine-rich copper-binding protein CopC
MRSVLVVVAVLTLAAARDAQAHAFLVKADPAVGSTVSSKPATLRLEFSEAVELGFSGIELAPASGSPLALKDVHFADDGHKVLVAGLSMLAAGTYRVRWHVVSVDTHRTEGEFAFTVKP